MTDAGRYDVIVIGGGPNGLAAAALLAKAGRRVVVLERSEHLGGLAVGREFHPGYTSVGLHHDTGALCPEIVADLGLEDHGLALGPPPPVLAARDDGRGLLLHRDPEEARAEIAALSPRDADRYAEYRAFLGRTGGFVRGLLGSAPPAVPDGLRGLLPLARDLVALRRLGRSDMMELLRVAPMCVADWMNEWFEAEPLKCVLAAPALEGTFAGPWSPGTSALLIRAEAGQGLAARGGPRSVVDALVAAARRAGAELRTEARVRGIRVDGGAAEGVSLDDGRRVNAPVVAASCDPKHTFLDLLPPTSVSAQLEHRIERLRATGTAAKVDLALSGPLRFASRPELDIERAARTGRSLDAMERAFDAVKYRRFSAAPILDVYIPTLADPGLAPGGGHVVSILAHYAPYALEGGWVAEEREALGDAVMTELERHAPGAAASLVAREVLTPVDIEARYGVTGGHLHHAEHALDQLLARPCPECARYATPIAGLYLCGSGSHPGGGLTGRPGLLAAREMLART